MNILVGISLTPDYKCAAMNTFASRVCLLAFLSDGVIEVGFCCTGKVEMCYRNVLLQGHFIQKGGSTQVSTPHLLWLF